MASLSQTIAFSLQNILFFWMLISWWLCPNFLLNIIGIFFLKVCVLKTKRNWMLFNCSENAEVLPSLGLKHGRWVVTFKTFLLSSFLKKKLFSFCVYFKWCNIQNGSAFPLKVWAIEEIQGKSREDSTLG